MVTPTLKDYGYIENNLTLRGCVVAYVMGVQRVCRGTLSLYPFLVEIWAVKTVHVYALRSMYTKFDHRNSLVYRFSTHCILNVACVAMVTLKTSIKIRVFGRKNTDSPPFSRKLTNPTPNFQCVRPIAIYLDAVYNLFMAPRFMTPQPNMSIVTKPEWVTGEDGEQYLVGPKECGRCKRVKTAAIEGASDYAIHRATSTGFSSICKECRKGDTKSPEFRARRRELYRMRRESEFLLLTTSEQTQSGLTTNKTRLNYDKSSAIGILKGREYAGDNVIMARDFGITPHTLLNWQRDGCPKRMSRVAWEMNRQMLVLREQMLRNGESEDAAMFLRILKQEGWHVGHLA